MVFPVKKIQSEHARVFPQFLSTQSVKANPTFRSATTDLFNLYGARFAALAQKENVNALKANLIEIDISEELVYLKADHCLEITIPVLGLTDLLGLGQLTPKAQQFACPVAINGFGAKSDITTLNNFPHPDFVLVTDIAGNQYEVIVNQDGKLELPSDGTGLFSIVSAITYIYSERQVKHGDGFENLQSEGIAANKLFLLPPLDCQEAFVPQICVTHIDHRHKRIVDTIRKVEIEYPKKIPKDLSTHVTISRVPSEDDQMVSIKISLDAKSSSSNYPLIACVTVEPLNNVNFSLHNAIPVETNGWLQHPIHSSVFTKHLGLSESTLNFLIRHIYSEYDFMKDYLKGDTFSLSHQNGYNNFLLMPEVFGRFYDFLLHDLIHCKLTADFLFARVPEERLCGLDLSVLPVDFHDSIVLSQLQSRLAEGNFQDFKKLFRIEAFTQEETMEHFLLHAKGLGETLPQVSISLVDNQSFLDSKLEKVEQSLNDDPWSQFSSNANAVIAHLSPEQNKLKSGIYNGVDLGQVLESASAWTPMMTTSTKEIVEQVDITALSEKNESDNAKPEVKPSTEGEIDPSRLPIRR